MKKNKEDSRAEKGCILESDIHGNPNLCCCYIMGVDGKLEDPCYYPANQCCRETVKSSA